MDERRGISTDLKILEDLAGWNEDGAQDSKGGIELPKAEGRTERYDVIVCTETRTRSSVKPAGSGCSSRGLRAGFVLTQCTWLFPRRQTTVQSPISPTARPTARESREEERTELTEQPQEKQRAVAWHPGSSEAGDRIHKVRFEAVI